MAARTRDMTRGNPTKLILSFCLPIIAGNLFQQFYSLVDTLVIGRVEGVTALAAVSAAGWLDWTVLGLAMGMAQGFSIQIAQSFGAGDYAELRRAAGQSILLSAAITVVLTLLSELLLWPMLTALRSPENTIGLTCQYLRVIFGGVVFVMSFNLLSGFLRSLGDSRTPLIAMTTAALCNIGLDILFVAVFRWGVNGVSIATVMSQCLSSLICLQALRKMPVIRITRADLKPDSRVMRKLGFNAATRLTGLIELAGNSLGSAVSTFAGQNLGAKKLDRVRLGLRRSAQIGVGMALVIALLVVLFGRSVLSLFINDDPALVEQVLTVGCRYLYVASAGLFMLYLLFVYRSTLQGLGDTVTPMISGVVELVMRIGNALLLPLLIGEWGVYFAEISAWIGAAIFLIFGYYRRMRILSAQFGESPSPAPEKA